ncbi:hypothetical protein LINPERHAP2_LOCUS19309 [Linum perenne]
MVKVPISGWRDGLDDGSIIGDIVHPLIILVTSAVADFCTGNEEWDVAVVADFCTGNEEWDVAKLSALFPNPILQSVFGMSPPSCDLEGDTLIWGLEPNGKYLVKTGYLLAKVGSPVFTLNMDGSVMHLTGEVSAGGCLRDGDRKLLD